MVYGLAHKRRWHLRWVRRAATMTALTVGIVAAAIRPAAAAPAQPNPLPSGSPTPSASAEPRTKPTGPNAGAMPTPAGSLAFPTPPAPIPPAPAEAIGPLAAEIINASNTTERLGEQLKALNEELSAAQAVTAQFRAAHEPAAARLAELKAKAAEILAEVYKDASALGPFQEYADDLQDLGLVAPALPGQLGQNGRPEDRDHIGDQLIEAEAAELAARANLDAAIAAEAEVAHRRTIVEEQFRLHQAALTTLKTRNAAMLGDAQAARDAYEDSQTAARGLGTSINGLQAAPRSLTAVDFALKQLGKMYEWAAEGPNTYDCSGLMYASYRQVGITLPRVSRYQYGAGTPVLVSQLLPGDLLFFSTDRRDWRQIHHVAMYLGNGKMIHAPTFGERVKISPIWWSEYFGATRVIPAVAGPSTAPPTATATPSPAPTQTVTPTATATPTETSTPAPTGTATPTPTATATPTPTATSTPSPTPSPSPPVTTTPAPTSTPTATATTTQSITPTPTQTADGTSTPASTAAALATLPATNAARRAVSRRPRRLPWQRRRPLAD